jgi:hypothetical protein
VPDPKLQAAALRLIADHVEHGERALSPELVNALALELKPADAEELDALAVAMEGNVPAWHLEEIERRQREDDGQRTEWTALRDRLLAARRSA